MRNEPPVHSRWKPGQSGNKSGKPKQLLTRDKVSSVVGKFACMTRDELQDVIKNPKSSMLEITVAAIMARAAKDGDFNRLNFILDRSIGKVTSEEKEFMNEVISVTPENIAELCRAAREGAQQKPTES